MTIIAKRGGGDKEVDTAEVDYVAFYYSGLQTFFSVLAFFAQAIERIRRKHIFVITNGRITESPRLIKRPLYVNYGDRK